VPGQGTFFDLSAFAVKQDGRSAHFIFRSDVRAGKQLREVLQLMKLHRIHSFGLAAKAAIFLFSFYHVFRINASKKQREFSLCFLFFLYLIKQ
jgi:hypothetical protein